ncbi:MAG: hypothetical protein IT289_05970 [Oligoflexia bacterium]|nr:hypothetical protein [Oligoflexia bacterium]
MYSRLMFLFLTFAFAGTVSHAAPPKDGIQVVCQATIRPDVVRQVVVGLDPDELDSGQSYMVVGTQMPIPVPVTKIKVKPGRTLIEADHRSQIDLWYRLELKTNEVTDGKVSAEFLVQVERGNPEVDTNASCEIFDNTLVK